VRIPLDGDAKPAKIVLDSADDIAEITEANNVVQPIAIATHAPVLAPGDPSPVR